MGYTISLFFPRRKAPICQASIENHFHAKHCENHQSWPFFFFLSRRPHGRSVAPGLILAIFFIILAGFSLWNLVFLGYGIQEFSYARYDSSDQSHNSILGKNYPRAMLHLHVCRVACFASISIPPHSVRIQVGVGATPEPECGAQSKQTIYARC